MNTISAAFDSSRETFLDIFHNNGRLFTWFAVAIIIVGGLSITSNPSNWWVPVLSVVGLFLAFFLFFNFRVIIKVIISLITMSLIASSSFELGYSFDMTGLIANAWITSTVFLYFASLAISYFLSSAASRWGTVILTQIFFFVFTFITVPLIPNAITVFAVLFLSLVFFIIVYKFGFKSRFVSKAMPVNKFDKEFVESIEKEAARIGWNVRVINAKKNFSVLTWGETDSNETMLFAFYPVRMEQQFAISGKRKHYLSYKTKNINNWLINVSHNVAPLWKLRGASPFPVLADLNKENGDHAKTIGVKLPDTKKKMPFGIVPAKTRKKKLGKIIETSLNEFADYMVPLTNKQITALENIGKKESN